MYNISFGNVINELVAITTDDYEKIKLNNARFY
jgi:hypothetical protein